MDAQPRDSIGANHSIVVSWDSIRLAFLLASLHGIEIVTCNIVSNVCLNVPCCEKIWFQAGKEFGEHEGKAVIVHQALYGLQTSWAFWRQRLADTTESEDIPGFIGSVAY